MRGKTDLVVLLIAVAAILFFTGFIKFAPQTESAMGSGETQTSGAVGYATTLTVGGVNAITGASVDVNGEAFSNDLSFATGEIQVNSQPETLSSAAPNTMSGYAILWNDANQGTDRGTEVYARKVPFSYQNKGTYQIKDADGSLWVKLYDESTPTWTGYDDGSAESTLNITVGSGQTVTSTELKIAAGSDAVLGNPDFDRPLAVCFNASSLSDWDEIRPTNYVGTFSPCEKFSGRNMLDKCYILPTGALKDYEEYRFYIVLDAATGTNPGPGATVYAYLLDKTYYKNDQGMWESGWCDDSVEGTDYDPGIAAIGNEKVIHIT